MSDQTRLAEYVAIWRRAIDDVLGLLDDLSAEEWSRDTDLPGWSVHDIVAHLAHLEAVLAGAPEETVEVGQPPHVRGLMGIYTEQGVVARRDRSPAELIAELTEAADRRHDRLMSDPPTDAGAQPDPIFGGVPWDWERLLRNRPLDVWMHEQDIRRAVGKPGNLDSPAARHTADYLAQSLGFIVGKRVGAAPGTTVTLAIEGHDPVSVRVDDGGRGVVLPTPAPDPDVWIATDRETFVVLAGGRQSAPGDRVELVGDADLGQQIIAAMAVTP